MHRVPADPFTSPCGGSLCIRRSLASSPAAQSIGNAFRAQQILVANIRRLLARAHRPFADMSVGLRHQLGLVTGVERTDASNLLCLHKVCIDVPMSLRAAPGHLNFMAPRRVPFLTIGGGSYPCIHFQVWNVTGRLLDSKPILHAMICRGIAWRLPALARRHFPLKLVRLWCPSSFQK